MEWLDGAPAVSRETLDRLKAFENLVLKWTTRINLIGRSTAQDIWRRHILDSVQLADRLLARPGRWADLGSGAGFPGLVLAIIAKELSRDTEVHLVESDQRKATFLRTAARELEVPCSVHAQRIEALEPLGADVISARALAPLTELLPLYAQHRTAEGIGLFFKGKQHKKEVNLARESWQFGLRVHPSQIEAGSAILEIGEVARV